MTDEKIFSQKDIEKIVDRVYKGYLNIFYANKMNFTEFAILENVLIRLQEEIRKEMEEMEEENE